MNQIIRQPFADAQAAFPFVIQQGRNVEQRIYTKRYPTFNYGAHVPVVTEGNEWAIGTMFFTVDVAGEAKFISGAGNDLPFSSASLLALRGEAIGMNETMTALHKARHDAVAQQIASGKIAQQDVRKVWKHTAQEHPRLHHLAMNGKSVVWGEKFVLPNGVEMDYPHAPDAPANETLFCKCQFSIKIDYFGSVERRFRAEAV